MCNLMRPFKLFVVPLLCCFSKTSFCQTIDKMFSSNWADTRWIYIFKKDGTYQRISNGHYGNTKVNGTYKMYNDTIELLTGFEKTHGTVNRLYLLDKNGFLIDLWLRYDYAPFKGGNNYITGPSRKRDIKYPQVDTKDSSQKRILREMIIEILNTDTLKKHLQLIPNDKEIYISNYYLLNDTTQEDIYIQNRNIHFTAIEKIKSVFFIEIEDINMNPSEVDISLIIRKQNRTYIRATFYFENGVWKLSRIYEI